MFIHKLHQLSSARYNTKHLKRGSKVIRELSNYFHSSSLYLLQKHARLAEGKGLKHLLYQMPF